MSVNREARDRLANALAAYMRGEIDNLEFDRIAQALPGDDRSVNSLIFALWFLYDDFKSHPICVSEEGWHSLRAILAFLRTDLEQPEKGGGWSWLHRDQIPGLIVIIVMGVALWWFWGNWWLLGFCWMAMGALDWLRVGPCSKFRHDPATPGFPFENEAQRRAHEHLADEFNLPPYDPARHGTPTQLRNPVVQRFMTLPGGLLLIAVMPLLSLLNLRPRRKRQS